MGTCLNHHEAVWISYEPLLKIGPTTVHSNSYELVQDNSSTTEFLEMIWIISWNIGMNSWTYQFVWICSLSNQDTIHLMLMWNFDEIISHDITIHRNTKSETWTTQSKIWDITQEWMAKLTSVKFPPSIFFLLHTPLSQDSKPLFSFSLSIFFSFSDVSLAFSLGLLFFFFFFLFC